MEHLLWLYALPHDPQYPVVCYDERPGFLIGDLIPPLPMQPGRLRKEHYADEKNGSCVLLGAIEPLTGWRRAQVQPRRTKYEYTCFCQAIAAAFPAAITIRLVQDNLNTHNASAFYEHLPADEAFALAQRFALHYTPKAASWLNMIECAFSAIARACLHQRIPTIEQVRSSVLEVVAERHAKRIKIHWQFSIQTARSKLNRHYERVHAANVKHKET